LCANREYIQAVIADPFADLPDAAQRPTVAEFAEAVRLFVRRQRRKTPSRAKRKR
jgi:hypothetical protein